MKKLMLAIILLSISLFGYSKVLKFNKSKMNVMDKSVYYNKLKNSTVAQWNAWRKANPKVKVDLRNTRLPNCKKLSRIDLSGAMLNGADMQNCVMEYANFQGADLSGAKLRFAKMKHAHFENSILKNTDFFKGNFQYAVFSDADLTGAQLITAHMQDAYFGKAKLVGANLLRGYFQLAMFLEADLSGANLEGARCTKAHFSKAVLDGRTNFKNTELNEAVFTEAKFFKTDLRAAKLGKNNFSKAELVEVNLSGKNFATDEYDFNEAVFYKAILIGTNFQGNDNLKKAIFMGADLKDTVFTMADFEGANFQGARNLQLGIERKFYRADAKETKFYKQHKRYLDNPGDDRNQFGRIRIVYCDDNYIPPKYPRRCKETLMNGCWVNALYGPSCIDN